MIIKFLLSILLGAFLFLPADAQETKARAKPKDVFQTTNVWTAHLIFTPEQWAAMEPKQGPRAQRPPGAGGFSLQGPEGGRNGIMAAFGLIFDYAHADLELDADKFKDVGVRYKGNGTFMSSQATLKRSLKIDFNQFAKSQKFAGLSQVNLHNSVRDPSSMNEAVAYTLFRNAGLPAPRTAYAKVYVTVPGKHDRKYFGLYTLVEDVGNAFAEEWFKAPGGALFKPVTPNLFADLGDDWKSYNQTYDPKGSLTDEQKKRVIAFAKFVTAAGDAEFAAQLSDYLDMDNFARYMALTAWLADLDGILGPGQNYYVYLHPATRKFMFLPWDQDQTFGQFPRGSTIAQRDNLSIHQPGGHGNRFLERVFKVEAFKKAYLAKLQEFNDTILKPGPIHQQVDQLAAVLRAPVEEESPERLAELKKAAAGQNVTIQMGMAGPGGGGTEVKSIKAFVTARSQAVKDQLAGKSRGETIDSGFGFARPPGQRPPNP